MKCEVEYCIYNRDFECILKRIEINSLGMCEECIIVSIDKKILKTEKKRQLRKIESRWVDTDK